MAAGQEKKRLNAANLVSYNLKEQYRAKKKKNVESSQNVLNMRPRISLDWDVTQKKAVAKREQIGITWRDIAPFINSGCGSNRGLADVFPIPREIFGLEDLTGVLSLEVWETLLSESERKLLAQFLPRGTDVDQVVQALLLGDNLHFGNSFIIWGTSLCSGNVQPDAVLSRDQGFMANKKAYYSELQKYHTDMIKNLQKLKDIWMHSKDPEKDFVDEMWRKGFKKHRQKSSLADSGRAKAVPNARKEEMSDKSNGCSGNADKYLSYLKISKRQHQLVRKIEQGGNGIQSRSLNHVLGDVKSLQIHSYEVFEEEEKKKLHEHWLQVSRRNIPAAFSHWRESQLHRQRCRKSLEQEIVEMKETSIDEGKEKEKPEASSFQEHGYDGGMENRPAIDVQNHEENGDSVAPSTHHSPPQHLSPLNGHHEVGSMFLDSENCDQEIPKQKGALILSQFQENRNPLEDDGEPEAPDDAAKEVWQAGSLPDSFYHATTMSHKYTSAGESPLGKRQKVEEYTSCLVDLETEMLKQEAGETSLPRPSSEIGPSLHIDKGAPLFSSYTDRDCNELIPESFSGQGLLQSYTCGSMNSLKQPGLHFLMMDDGPPDNNHFPRQFQDQQQRLFEQQRIREKELYMHQATQKNMYSNGRYQTQEPFLPMDVQDWDADSIREVPFRTSANGRVSGPGWFSQGNHACNGWSDLDVSLPAGQCVGDRRNTDALSVLSQGNNLQSPSLYASMSSGQLIPATNFVGGGISGNSDIFAYSSQQLGYLNVREAAAAAATAALKANNTSWMMNLTHPNSSLHDPIGTPFLRSWNQ
ncbi:uncharacterized protein LOC131239282 isoform X2 [Magnolia sinica]|uniref:uncharacterized protein LOC131239282 isoform X2 n=1 Tax=Magnolia sinica TaxID=86752 RepID=UPI0026597FBF|nr:uncharacterized protein LOC131239282 isoform X2 [Magnolia sinica]